MDTRDRQREERTENNQGIEGNNIIKEKDFGEGHNHFNQPELTLAIPSSSNKQLVQIHPIDESRNLWLDPLNVETSQSTVVDNNNPVSSILPANSVRANLKGCTRNHIGTKIETPSVTIINNAPNNLVYEQQNIKITRKQRDLYNICKSKIKILSLTILVVMLGISYILYTSTTNSVLETAENTTTSNKTQQNMSANIAIIPEPWFVNRTGWNASVASEINHCRLNQRIISIIVSEVRHSACNTIQGCTKVLQKIQEEHKKIPLNYGDIDYNFLIGEDGRIYEGRGWEYCNPNYFYSAQFITIALLGNYSCSKNYEFALKTMNLQFNALELFINRTRNDLLHYKEKQFSKHSVIIPDCCTTRNSKLNDSLLHNYVAQYDGHFNGWKSCLNFKRTCSNKLC